jgi:hypothetical protein
MRYALLIAVALAAVATQGVCAEDNAPAEDRQLMAKMIREALVAEAAKAKIEGKSEDRHREVIKNPIKDIVTYWRSEVSGTATFVEPDKKLTVEVPTLVRTNGKATITVKVQTAVKGDVAGKVLTDDKKQIAAVTSPYTCTLTVTSGCTVNPRGIRKNAPLVNAERPSPKPIVVATHPLAPAIRPEPGRCRRRMPDAQAYFDCLFKGPAGAANQSPSAGSGHDGRLYSPAVARRS